MAGLTLAGQGWMNNLIVYMIGEYNVKSIDAAQIWNVVNGCVTMFPILGAIIADSFLGCFSVIWISSLISLLGIVLLVLSATLDSLRPPPCDNGSNLCIPPSKLQFAVVYLGMTFATIGAAGTRFTLGTMGADQFNNPKHQGSFFNWFISTLYISSAISSTVIVYVEDNVSWGLGFGLCAVANVVGFAVFMFGSRFYHHVRPQGSPFTGLARVVVAAIRKRKILLSLKSEDDYHRAHDGEATMVASTPTTTFKFLNRAALKTEGDIGPDGSITNLWKLCTLQQVEDLKTLIKLFPLWSTGIFLSTPLAIQSSLATLQALTMDRHLGPHFKIPPGSMLVFIMVSAPLTIILLDQFLYPAWQKITGRFPPPLQRIGIGHVLCVLSMAVSAVVEFRRLKTAQDVSNSIVPMSVFWLVPQLALAGIGEAFHFPGNTALFYQEFPAALKSTATAMVAMFIGIAYYLSTALVGVVRRATGWLPNDINQGRMDHVYWVLFVVGVVNFGYYLVCAWLYKYQGQENVADQSSTSNK
ncbi:major facilitator superfamily protein [Actinidia rufa]|uniref:Major facilitator superfamily protein n=1 Tax=Actinidia rufa TaxID=165716 RepID=A0A7J0HBX0_9ERIC|nr:major facilitator superfamily protein [Actinidia rufa]